MKAIAEPMVKVEDYRKFMVRLLFTAGFYNLISSEEEKLALLRRELRIVQLER